MLIKLTSRCVIVVVVIIVVGSTDEGEMSCITIPMSAQVTPVVSYGICYGYRAGVTAVTAAGVTGRAGAAGRQSGRGGRMVGRWGYDSRS